MWNNKINTTSSAVDEPANESEETLVTRKQKKNARENC
jgi:hypothetical protein